MTEEPVTSAINSAPDTKLLAQLLNSGPTAVARGWAGVSTGRRHARLASVADYRKIAKRRLPRAVFDFVDGAAGEEYTMRWNEEAYRRYVFRPQVFTDTSGLDVSTTVLGKRAALPVILGPSGSQGFVSRLGELDVARAAAAAGTVYVLGVASSRSLEEVADAAPGGRLWFQLYLWQGRNWAEELISRARAANYEAICVTADVKAPGARKYRDIRNGIAHLPESLSLSAVIDAGRRPRWLANYLRAWPVRLVHMIEGSKGAGMLQATEATYRRMDPAATWDEIRWLRRLWDGPLIIKGIMNPEDAAAAFDCGVDAVICSNHGGRNLDGAPAALDVLPRIIDVAGDHEVYIDSGIRTGGDVVKALALGATACAIVRPFFWGLAVDGQAGVEAVIDIFGRELASTMTALGVPTIADIDRGVIERRDGIAVGTLA